MKLAKDKNQQEHKGTRLLTIKEAAYRLGMAPSWVYRESKNGNLPATIISFGPRKRSIRVDSDRLEKWIDERRIA